MILLVLKAIASVLAAGYGIYATLTDFHEKREGVDKLTKAGKRGIAFLLIVSALGIAVDLGKEWDARRKEMEGQKSSAETADELKSVLETAKSTTKTLDSVLTEARRAGDPLEHEWMLSFGFNIDGGQSLLRPYLDRTARSRVKGAMDVDFRDSESGFPTAKLKGEAALAKLANFSGLSIDFYKGPSAVIAPSAKPVYSLDPICSGHKKLTVDYGGIGRSHPPSVSIECEVDTRGLPNKRFPKLLRHGWITSTNWRPSRKQRN